MECFVNVTTVGLFLIVRDQRERRLWVRIVYCVRMRKILGNESERSHRIPRHNSISDCCCVIDINNPEKNCVIDR